MSTILQELLYSQRKTGKIALFVMLLIFACSYSGQATISITTASASICKNYAATGGAPRYTALGTISIKENSNRDFGNSSGFWSATVVIAPPAGWQFNPLVSPALTYTAARNITGISIGSFSATALSITVVGTNKSLRDQFSITGLQVQATSTTSVAGNIKPSSISGTITGLSTSSNLSTLTPTTPSSGTASVTIASSPSGTICSGTNVTFTATATNGGTAPIYQWKLNGSNITGATASTYSSTSLANGNVITCSLISNSCITTPTATSGSITMSVNPTPSVVNFTSQTATSPCAGAGSTVSVVSSTLGSSSFIATFSLSGANNGSGYTDTLVMSGSTGSFPIKAFILDTSGSNTVTVTNITSYAGCSAAVADSNVASFATNALPAAVTASGAGTYCGSTTITASNGSSGTIYFQGTTSGGTSTATPATSQVVSSSGIYYFRAQSSAGCWGPEGSVTVVINPLPATVTVSGGGTFCGSATLTASNGSDGTIYFQGTTSGGTATAIPSTSQLITTSGIWYFRAQSSAGCWGTQGSAAVTINPNPAAITGTAVVCSGSSTSLSETTTGGTWSSANTSIATVGSTGTTNGIAAGITTISYSLPTTCYATATVTVNNTPAAIGGASAVCSGSSTTLTNTSANGIWTSSNTSIATVGSTTGLVTGIANGVATITYSTGCGTAATKLITVGNSPVTGTLTVCTGATTTLSNASLGGSWTSANTAIATVGALTGVVTGVAGGTATISYTTGGCTATAVVTVNVAPAAITGTASACVALTSTLASTTPYGTWTSSNTSIATVGSTGIVTGVAAGNANITYSTGCGSAATRAFTVNPLPAAITGSATVCTGSSTTLSDASTGGTWTSGATGIATIGSTSGITSGVAAGTAAITYTLSTGCRTTGSITVNPLPSAIGGTGSVCVAATTTLTSGTSGGNWTSSNTAVATIGSSSGTVSGIAAGNATITYILSTGCFTTSVATVNPLPAAISGTAYACIGATSTLSDAGGGTWLSSNPSRASIGTSTGVVTGIVAGTTTITYTLPTGCRTTTIFTVNPLPAAITGTATLCVGATSTLTDAGGGTWTSSNTSIGTIGSSSGVVTGIAAGNTNITYTLSTGCLTSTPVTVNPLPYAGTISGVTTVCEDDTTSLSSGVAGGTWSSYDSTIASVDATGIVTGQSGGNTNITYSYTNSCGTDFTFVPVTVNPLPNADTIAGVGTLCAGTTLLLSSIAPGGVWTSATTAVATVGSSSGLVSGLSAGTSLISYTVTNSCGVDFDTLTVTVLPLPAAISGTAVVCVGATTTLTDATSGGTWTSGNTSIATVGSTGTVTGIGAGTVNVSYTLATGCYVTKSVTVNPLPSAISGTATVCMGSTTTLTDAGGGTWTSSNTAIATIGSSSGIVTPVAAGSATISYTLSTGCRTTTGVTVSLAPTLASATNNGPICAGATLSLTANTPTNVTAYLWSGPVAITASTTAAASVPSATTLASGTYSVTVSNGSGAGCSRTYTTTATVNALPTAAPTNNSPICTGGTVTLSANPGGSTNTYTWSGTGLSSTTAQNPTSSPTVTTTYSLTVRYNTGLPGCSPATVYTTVVTVNSIPTAAPTNNGPVCSASTVTLTANPGGSTNTYAWSGPFLASTTAQNPTATPTVTSTYSLTVSYGIGQPGCSPATVYTTAVTVRPTGYWLGSVSNAWTTGTNWCGGVPLTTTSVLIPTGATYYPTITTGTSPAGSITIQTGASLTVNGGSLQISGSISNSGTFTATNGSIELNGSSAQTIPAGVFAGNTIKNLTINNSAGATLGGTLSLSGILKATTGNLATGGNLTLLSTSTQTALIDGSGAGEVTGNVTMQRYLDTGYGYRYISSPFTSATVSGLAGSVSLSSAFPNFYSYNENLAYSGWQIDTIPTAVLTPLSGYAANFGSSFSSKTVSLTGVVNNHTISATLYNHNNAYTLGYNLVGNPYPSPIDWNASSGWVRTNIDNAIYYFNSGDTNQYYGSYSSYVAGVSSDGIANNIIPAMQGFFIHVSNGTYPVSGTFSVNNPARVNNLTPYYHKGTTSDKPLLRLQAGFGSGSSRRDNAVVYLDDAGTDSFNNNIDALKLLNTDASVPSLYTIASDNNNLSIQAITLSADSTKIIPLGLQTQQDGIINFNAATIANMPTGTNVFFIDASAGITQNLGSNPSYAVQLGAGTYNNRFFLGLTKNESITLPGHSSELNAYTIGDHLFVYLTLGSGELVLSDVAGRTITSTQLSGSGYHDIRCPFASGIYFATLYSATGKQVKKIFLGKQ